VVFGKRKKQGTEELKATAQMPFIMSVNRINSEPRLKPHHRIKHPVCFQHHPHFWGGCRSTKVLCGRSSGNTLARVGVASAPLLKADSLITSHEWEMEAKIKELLF